LQTMQEVNCTLRAGCSGEDGALVVLQHLQPSAYRYAAGEFTRACREDTKLQRYPNVSGGRYA
jgi:hypothetical protein